MRSESGAMREPYLSMFRDLVRQGAGAQDIHDATAEAGYAAEGSVTSPAFLEREVRRVEAHERSLCPLIETFVGRAPAVLDVGCSTGGTTVALAKSRTIDAREVIGIDPSQRSIEAARVRALGYDLPADRVRFQQTVAGEAFPFETGRFDLAVCVSVLEFISSPDARGAFAAELMRVVRPGGHIFVATPTPFRLREHHSRRILGDYRRRDGFPWASPPWALRRIFKGCRAVPIHRAQAQRVMGRIGLGRVTLPEFVARAVGHALPWQKVLWQNAGGAGDR